MTNSIQGNNDIGKNVDKTFDYVEFLNVLVVVFLVPVLSKLKPFYSDLHVVHSFMTHFTKQGLKDGLLTLSWRSLDNI